MESVLSAFQETKQESVLISETAGFETLPGVSKNSWGALNNILQNSLYNLLRTGLKS